MKKGDEFMTTYGIGYKYKDNREDVSNQFLNRNIACMGHNPDEYLYYTNLYKEINDEDIIFLKTAPWKEQKLRIRAIGIATNPQPEQKGTIGYGIDVNWIKNFENNIKECNNPSDGGWHPRGGSIYKEYNPQIIKFINDLLQE